MAELYLFSKDNVNFGFTPTLNNKSLSGITYEAAVITRSRLILSDVFGKSNITFAFDRGNNFALDLLHNFPEKPVIVTIFKDSIQYWKGRFLEAKADESKINITCENSYTSLARGGRQAVIKLQCRHRLYSASCGVSQPIWKSAYAVSNVNSSLIAVSGLSEATGYFNGGIAVLNGQTRHIRKHESINITLSYPFTGILSGDIELYPGCLLTEAACAGFSNLINHGGFERHPAKDPFGAEGLL